MKPLRPALLAGLAVGAGALSWAGSRMWEALGTLPGVPVAAPVVLFLIAVALLATALSLRSRLRAQREREPDAKGVDPMTAARAVIFAHASALVVALVAGLYGGLGIFLLLGHADTQARRQDLYLAGLSVAGCVAVVVVAFFVQRICRLPDDEDTPPPDGEGEDGSPTR